MTRFYDPPEGWRYGFPKPYAPLAGEDLLDTLRRDGYPDSLFDSARRATRFWEEETAMTNDKVRSFIERIGRLEEQKAEFAGDIRDVISEAKSDGHDVKALRAAVRIWRKDAAKRKAALDELDVLDTYLAQVGLK